MADPRFNPLIPNVETASRLIRSAEKEFGVGTSEFRSALVALARQSFWFYLANFSNFAGYCAPKFHETHGGKTWATHPFIVWFCNIVQWHYELRDDPKVGRIPFFNFARFHYKTTVMHEFFAWCYATGRNDACLLGTYKLTGLGKTFLRTIRSSLLSLRKIFPERIPPASEWIEDSKDAIRPMQVVATPTFSVFAITAIPAGPHAGIVAFDDVVIDACKEDPTIAQAIRNCIPLGTDNTWYPFTGTRWGKYDAYGRLSSEGFFSRHYRLSCYHRKTGEPLLLAAKHIEDWRKSMGDYVFASQMLNEPIVNVENRFDDSLLRSHGYELMPRDESGITRETVKNRYMFLDISQGKGHKGDSFVISVVALGEDNRWSSVDLYWGTPPLREQLDLVFKYWSHWRPSKVLYENIGHIDYGAVLKEEMKHRSIRFETYGLTARSNKTFRIKHWYDKVVQGDFVFPKFGYGHSRRSRSGGTVDTMEALIQDHLLTFDPYSTNNDDDPLDCLALTTTHEVSMITKAPVTGDVLVHDFSHRPSLAHRRIKELQDAIDSRDINNRALAV